MTQEEQNLHKVLTTLGRPVAFMLFKTPKPLPFIVYRGEGSYTLQADNIVYYSRERFAVELYFEEKNNLLEAKLESALTTAGYIWRKSDDVYIENERMYVTTYSI